MDKQNMKDCKRILTTINLHESILKRLDQSMTKNKQLQKKYKNINKEDLKELNIKTNKISKKKAKYISN